MGTCIRVTKARPDKNASNSSICQNLTIVSNVDAITSIDKYIPSIIRALIFGAHASLIEQNRPLCRLNLNLTQSPFVVLAVAAHLRVGNINAIASLKNE